MAPVSKLHVLSLGQQDEEEHLILPLNEIYKDETDTLWQFFGLRSLHIRHRLIAHRRPSSSTQVFRLSCFWPRPAFSKKCLWAQRAKMFLHSRDSGGENWQKLPTYAVVQNLPFRKYKICMRFEKNPGLRLRLLAGPTPRPKQVSTRRSNELQRASSPRRKRHAGGVRSVFSVGACAGLAEMGIIKSYLGWPTFPLPVLIRKRRSAHRAVLSSDRASNHKSEGGRLCQGCVGCGSHVASYGIQQTHVTSSTTH